MEFVFAYAAGLLTLINPCVVPVLPIVLATALQASKHGPAALALGMSISFVVLGMLVTTFGYAIGLTPETLSQAGAVLMIVFGAILLVPRFSMAFSTATAGVAAKADSGMDAVDNSTLRGQFLGGLLLGAVWSPCIGPTLGGAISLASQGENLGFAALIMVAFAAGVSTLILGLGYGARSTIGRHQATMRAIAAKSRPIMGAIFLATGLALFFSLHHVIEGWLLSVMPAWLIDLSVSV
ncbi:cytochrome c biogenesis protein CcdA [Shimia sp. R9_1]|uniref:cytochrome c biogenesis CcdA family protein n=1 Tax=unclassified Shimia TaxID=2630038 RepID=UPI001ADAB516|nr:MULTISPECIES: cytochrome c biogenesis CcdA family protein [unclassified Shimia]MBO9399562.1 cytochrome c biogenesis protein CcdA [Shimia sp. R9_3]MBO9407454.1 cytochrome c biogenesis protein CcdA [Shimia sp. R9_1]